LVIGSGFVITGLEILLRCATSMLSSQWLEHRDRQMILIGLGSNMAGPWGPPRQTLERAIAALAKPPLRLERASAIIQSEPWGKKDQPVYANAVARIKTRLQPLELLAHLRSIEMEAGRQRRERWSQRTLDLDIIDYNGMTVNAEASQSTDAQLVLPHPSLHERAFVLAPIAEVAPRWRHPVLHQTAGQLLRQLDDSQGGAILNQMETD
jgi:2-amino-4-hydroxy-6-hydroxymethyldihydropteridine diphosphokinase